MDLEFGHAYCLKPLDPFSAVCGLRDAPMERLDAQHAVGALHGHLNRLKCGGCERLAPQLRVQRAVRRFRTLLAHGRWKFSVEALALYPDMRTQVLPGAQVVQARVRTQSQVGACQWGRHAEWAACACGGGGGRGCCSCSCCCVVTR